jgi:putative FmdB family regulatory protein
LPYLIAYSLTAYSLIVEFPMPIYEFQCDVCGKPFEELFRSSSERRQMTCPGCGSKKVHKKFSSFAMGGAKGGGGNGGASSGCGGCARSSCSGCHG